MSSDTKHDMRIQKNALVPMQDGVELATDVYLPKDEGKYPAILSCYPYHKDGTLGYSYKPSYQHFTEHGYACVLTDCRGTGSSSGVTRDPLDGLNGQDLVDLVEWVASQPWCDGNVGMWGMSYGGMTALKAATMRPPHLKAIVSIMSPAIFYPNLAFPGGSMNMLGLGGAWCGDMNVMNLLPPLYMDEAGRWEQVWATHLDNYVPYLFTVAGRLTYDSFWKERDIPLAEVEVPIFIIEGWRDFAIRDGIQQYEMARGPKKILIGPWIHFAPNMAAVNPIDHLHEIRRWFDHWLKGVDSGIMDEPGATICVQATNQWRHEEDWPIKRRQEASYFLHVDNRLTQEGERGDRAGFHTYQSNATTGTTAGLMTVFPIGIDYPRDQRPDDALSLVYDSDPLTEDTEVTGAPRATLFLSSSVEDINVVVKLCDVAPDGSSSHVTTGWCKGSHRASHENPSPMKPGEVYGLDIPFFETSYCFRAGHRIRLSISCSDFPRIWPTPMKGEIKVYWGSAHPSRLSLPIIPAHEGAVPEPQFQPPDLSFLQDYPVVWLPRWRVVQDHFSQKTVVESGVLTEFPLEQGGSCKLDLLYWAEITGANPSTAELHADVQCTVQTEREEYVAAAKQAMTQTKISVDAHVSVDGKTHFEKRFEEDLSGK